MNCSILVMPEQYFIFCCNAYFFLLIFLFSTNIGCVWIARVSNKNFKFRFACIIHTISNHLFISHTSYQKNATVIISNSFLSKQTHYLLQNLIRVSDTHSFLCFIVCLFEIVWIYQFIDIHQECCMSLCMYTTTHRDTFIDAYVVSYPL